MSRDFAESELGIMHGPWNLTWADHDQRHRDRDFHHPTYVLNQMGRADEAWCQQCQRGVLLPQNIPDEGENHVR